MAILRYFTDIFAIVLLLCLSFECSDELALSYLEIFDDDVESAVTAFLESEPMEKQDTSSPHLEDQTRSNCLEQPRYLRQLNEVHGSLLQDHQQQHSPQPWQAPKLEDLCGIRTIQNDFKSAKPAASGTAAAAGMHSSQL